MTLQNHDVGFEDWYWQFAVDFVTLTGKIHFLCSIDNINICPFFLIQDDDLEIIEAAIQRFSIKKVFLKIWQNS